MTVREAAGLGIGLAMFVAARFIGLGIDLAAVFREHFRGGFFPGRLTL